MVTASNPSTIEIRAVSTPQELELFLDLPSKVYANDPNWVPPLRSSVAKQFLPENPFFEYGRLQQFIALRGDQAVGRIVAAVNDRLIEREGQKVGLFGFFECIEDFSVAQALLETACEWLRQQGMMLARGPINLSTHNGCLFLVDGFDTPPMVLMPYNPPYYPQFVEQDGWQKAQDAYSYNFPLSTTLPQEFEKAYRIACKSGVTFRPVRTKGEGFEDDARNIYRLTTQMFANNYSSTPRTEDEFLEEARSMQSLLDPDVFPIAEHNGNMVGYWMGLPDLNIPLKHVGGKLDLWGTLKFLWYRRQIDQGRVVLFCSLPEYRRKMVPLALIYLGMQGGIKKGKPYKRAELGHVFESNSASRKLVEAAGGTICKTYRIYEKALS
jgi:GNAT superfamily N-acetyltransferase